jgi:hypothetical protein
MYKKTLLLIILISISSAISYCQEHETVLTAPENWKSEIIPFPIGFASDIDFVGFEDLRFAPDWSKIESENFWTYSFVWYIETYGAMTESKLTEFFGSYYDGLMDVNSNNQADTSNSNQLDKAFCLFIKTDEGFKGKIRTHDKFFTKNYITLNIKVKEVFCPDMNKQIITCDISPKAFDHEVWRLFDDVKLKVKCE